MRAAFEVPGGLSVAADVYPGDRRTIVFLHGGGQTRQSWHNGVRSLVNAGHPVVSLDLRGHGESSWAPDGNYDIGAHVSDLLGVLKQIAPEPVLIGASLGGLVSLTAVGESEGNLARALVLVDVTPKTNPKGSKRIVDFMSAHPEGFETLEQVADAVAAYNPHRPRPKDISGLRRNVRQVNGRLFWHWDPQMLVSATTPAAVRERSERIPAAAKRIRIPTLLIRGGSSDVVGPEEVAWFRELVPHAQYVSVAGAGHMVAGDRNDAFNAAILEFIEQLQADTRS
jgi:pimeloyl-ACP methyl ester carboxylesterase